MSSHREDVYDLFPGVFATLEMKPDSLGTWLLHCHVNDHMAGGMTALFEVRSPTSKSVSLSVCPFICLLISVSVCPSHWRAISVPVCLFVCLFVNLVFEGL